MIKKVLFMMALVLLVLPMALALDTKINVYTLEAHDVTITILEPSSSYSSIRSFPNLYSGLEGLASVDYSGPEAVFHIKVLVKKNNLLILNEQFDDQSAGGTIDLDVYPEGYDIPEREDETDSEDTDENETEEDGEETSGDEDSGDEENLTLEENQDEDNTNTEGITGLAVGEEGEKRGLSKWALYIIGAIILVGAIGLGIAKGIQMKRAPPHEVKQTPERRDHENEDRSELVDDLSDAERKIEYLEKEVKKLKNQDKIKEMERKIEAEKEELERLRNGDEEEPQ